MNRKKDKKDKKVITSRRNILRLGLAAGATAALGKGIFSAIAGDEKKKSGEKVKLLSAEGKLVEVDRSDLCCEPVTSEVARQGFPNKKMVMVIDLARCRNARECLKGCQKMHHLPSQLQWIKFFLMRDSKDQLPYWFPKPCLHCNNPPCVKVCPVGATFKMDIT